MQITVEIPATDNHCSVTCRFLGWSGSNHICRAFTEPASGKRYRQPRSARIQRDDFLRYERCQQCKDATAPNDQNELRPAATAPALP